MYVQNFDNAMKSQRGWTIIIAISNSHCIIQYDIWFMQAAGLIDNPICNLVVKPPRTLFFEKKNTKNTTGHKLMCLIQHKYNWKMP